MIEFTKSLPLVSIIIPNYNHEAYLALRIDSVLSQTYQNFELIIMDDCSKDKSKEVIEQYRSNSKVSAIIFNTENSGSTFKQWKRGIELAKGEWIWIAESDDYCDANLLANLIEESKKCNNVVLSYCQSYQVNESGDILRSMSFYTDELDVEHWSNSYCVDGLGEIQKFLLYKNTLPNASAILFKKSAYIQADKSFESMKLCGDWMLWVQLLKIGKIAYCSESLNYFRTHSATTRVLDTLLKKRIRLEEEYKIVLDIKSIPGLSGVNVGSRIHTILKEYSMAFAKNSMFKYLVWPFSYKGSIPYYKLLSTKLKLLLE